MSDGTDFMLAKLAKLRGDASLDYSRPSGLAIVTALLLLVVTVATWRRCFSPLSDLPGPFWASITRLWHVKIIIAGDQNLVLSRLHEKYGHFIRMAPGEVSVTHPDAVRKIFLNPLRKGMFYNISAIPDWRYQTPMSTLDPKEKIERSKAFSSGYAQSNVIKYEDDINPLIEKLCGWLDNYAESGEPMNLDKFLLYTAFDVVGEVLFSKPFGFIEKGEDLGSSIAKNLAQESIGTPVAQFRWAQLLLGNPLVTTLGLNPGSMLMDTAMTAFRERQKNPDARYDIVAHWFRYLQEHPDRTNLRNIEAQTTTNVAAGSDTVTCALQSILYHLTLHPTTYDRARAEIDVARQEGRCGGKVVSFTDTQKLPYLQACIKEGLRIHAPVPMGLQRVAPKGGLTIGERIFPEGTTLSINPWVLHHSKELWGDDADDWSPERWLVEDTAALDKNWIPFGAGFNACPGQHVARMQLSKICATIIRDYDLKLVDPSKPWKWMAYFTMVPNSWPVYVAKRA
ncbi:cytochrome P450 [Pestalotiopsis sp. NC0098]|nr:cytochrome P450 [Pestalotiopsis sp. NC0098]